MPAAGSGDAGAAAPIVEKPGEARPAGRSRLCTSWRCAGGAVAARARAVVALELRHPAAGCLVGSRAAYLGGNGREA